MQITHTSPARRSGSGPILSARVTFVALLACCIGATPSASETAADMHADFDRFVQRHVDAAGTIDYSLALEDSADLDRYIAWLSEVSPDSHAELFPATGDQLAYWINAYNAWVIRKVLDHYPISSVKDLRSRWLVFLPRVAGFFYIEKIRLGGVKMNLYALENKIVRERFHEPRVHFALNCASQSCPRLPNRAFTASGLEAELARETLRFVSDSERVRVDTPNHLLAISSIFKWYKSDFTDWMKREHPDEPATLRNYLATQLPEPQASAVRSCDDCRIEFVDYDWGLNDRTAPPDKPRATLYNDPTP